MGGEVKKGGLGELKARCTRISPPQACLPPPAPTHRSARSKETALLAATQPFAGSRGCQIVLSAAQR